jgi:carboxyl-terminal processing protease
MKSRLIFNLTLFLSFFLIILTNSCRNTETAVPNKNGILGIEVPVGNGKVKPETPYLVVGVYEDSPAYKAGIRPDDVILQIDGTDIMGMEYERIYKNLLQGKAGSKVTFLIKRKNQSLVIEAVRAKRAKD